MSALEGGLNVDDSNQGENQKERDDKEKESSSLADVIYGCLLSKLKFPEQIKRTAVPQGYAPSYKSTMNSDKI